MVRNHELLRKIFKGDNNVAVVEVKLDPKTSKSMYQTKFTYANDFSTIEIKIHKIHTNTRKKDSL